MALILASGSPRRRELLERLGVEIVVRPADLEEIVPPGLPPEGVVAALSAQKARWVAARCPEELVIAADTVVSVDGDILGKPRDAADARAMLRRLSGRSHSVYTGLTLCRGGEEDTQCECTQVTFRPLTDGEIDAYIQTGEPMDKAGAYGIQALGALFVTGIQGDYYNVMGLPLCRLGRMLERFDVKLLDSGEKKG